MIFLNAYTILLLYLLPCYHFLRQQHFTSLSILPFLSHLPLLFTFNCVNTINSTIYFKLQFTIYFKMASSQQTSGSHFKCSLKG